MSLNGGFVMTRSQEMTLERVKNAIPKNFFLSYVE